MRCCTYVKKLSRACSPSLPMSMPASTCAAMRRRGCLFDCLAQLRRVDRLTLAAASVERGQRRWTREAPGVGRNDP